MSYVLLCIGLYFTMHQFHFLLMRASGFGLGLFALSFFPMSNILFPVGTLIAERLLYIPSVGYVIVIVSFFNFLWNKLVAADAQEAQDKESDGDEEYSNDDEEYSSRISR